MPQPRGIGSHGFAAHILKRAVTRVGRPPEKRRPQLFADVVQLLGADTAGNALGIVDRHVDAEDFRQILHHHIENAGRIGAIPDQRDERMGYGQVIVLYSHLEVGGITDAAGEDGALRFQTRNDDRRLHLAMSFNVS